MKVINILKPKGKKGNYIVEFQKENGDIKEYEISPEVFFRRSFSVDTYIEENELVELIKEDEKVKAREIALGYLDYGLKSRKEVEKKLKTKEISEDVINSTLDSAESYGYIDDENFTKTFINEKIRSKGRFKVIKDLMDKGIEKEIIDEAFTDEMEDKEYTYLLTATEKKYSALKNREEDIRKIKEKLMRFLLSRGYDYENIKRAMEEVLSNEMDDEYEDF